LQSFLVAAGPPKRDQIRIPHDRDRASLSVNIIVRLLLPASHPSCLPQVRKYVDAWSPPEASFLQVGSSKEAALRSLAEALYQRRPVLYLKGHAQAYPAQVLLRTVRKPSVGALSTAAAAAGLFKSPSNTVIVIKFDPQFGYAGESCRQIGLCYCFKQIGLGSCCYVVPAPQAVY
jgi:hypothetical protein